MKRALIGIGIATLVAAALAHPAPLLARNPYQPYFTMNDVEIAQAHSTEACKLTQAYLLGSRNPDFNTATRFYGYYGKVRGLTAPQIFLLATYCSTWANGERIGSGR